MFEIHRVEQKYIRVHLQLAQECSETESGQGEESECPSSKGGLPLSWLQAQGGLVTSGWDFSRHCRCL